MQDTSLLNNIAFGLVKDKVIQDKLEEAKVDEMKENANSAQKEEEEIEENDIDLDEPDSEEERIIQREMNKRLDFVEQEDEKKKEKALRRFGDVRDIVETEFLDTMLNNELVVCHFYHDSFDRCKIMDQHLRTIAESHHNTLFVRINAEKTPFFTAKLQIKILPTVVLFTNGLAADRIIGFEELGMRDNFPTINLTRRLVKAKMIPALNKHERGQINVNKIGRELDEEEYDY